MGNCRNGFIVSPYRAKMTMKMSLHEAFKYSIASGIPLWGVALSESEEASIVLCQASG